MRRGAAVWVLAALAGLSGALAEGGARAEGNPPVVEAYRLLLLEPTEEHLLDAVLAADTYANAPDARTVEFLRRHLWVTEGTVLVLDGEGYSDAEVASQCLDMGILSMQGIPGRRVKGIVSRWMEEENCPYRLHLVELSAEDTARCDAQARAWVEGYRAGRAGKARPDGAVEQANWLQGYYEGKAARKLAGE
jgi:hypothetical protein